MDKHAIQMKEWNGAQEESEDNDMKTKDLSMSIHTAELLRVGEYCRSLDTRSTASGGMRLWNI